MRALQLEKQCSLLFYLAALLNLQILYLFFRVVVRNLVAKDFPLTGNSHYCWEASCWTPFLLNKFCKMVSDAYSSMKALGIFILLQKIQWTILPIIFHRFLISFHCLIFQAFSEEFLFSAYCFVLQTGWIKTHNCMQRSVWLFCFKSTYHFSKKTPKFHKNPTKPIPKWNLLV